ncbi:hypothetical protein DQW50_06125 [Halorubrum sp. 48-1-W]|uniref:hypothetical protein n=1 Tax=Halorubrum sp. 48-1-W TaxID=2249761 RepID=UPI000DCD5BA5|nr:hypothetical protein [Halorubrum sp. 48-1-W]RAW46044.1 hypothetical protein DQW50_06125 [Halorubrum sp. 48-1-W]
MSADNPLFASGVLTTEERSVTLSEGFEEAVETYLSRFEGHTSEEFAAEIEAAVDDDVAVEPLAALGEEDPRTIAELCVLAERLGADDAKTDGNPVQLLPSLRLFRDDDVRSDGAPESFVPVAATQLPQLLRIYSPALVYVWLDDSEKCDLAKRDLETVFEEPQDVMPFAVYGPAYKEFLDREYSLTAGPAVLFTRDGAVEARIYGAHGPGTIETELERHRR